MLGCFVLRTEVPKRSDFLQQRFGLPFESFELSFQISYIGECLQFGFDNFVVESMTGSIVT